MSRAFTFLVIGMVILLTIFMQDVAAQVIGPGSGMYEMVSKVNQPVNGAEWADRMYVAITVWFMWLIRVAAIVGGLFREFTKQNVTARRGAGRGGP